MITLPYNWKARNYQTPAWQYMAQRPRGGRAVCVWHRRAGKDLFAINMIACKAHERVGLYWHIFPTYRQGKNVIWNGATKDGRRFLDHFPKDLIRSTNATDMRVEFENGSAYQVVGTDNIDSLVGTNPVGCVFSEYSLQNPQAWDYLRPILTENEGWALFIYTARGKNHGYKLLNLAKKNPGWFSEVLVAGDKGTLKEDGTPVIPDSAIEAERQMGMPEEIVQQEYYNSFEAPMFGAYYSQMMTRLMDQKRITSVPHEPRLPVDTYWDLGVNDCTGIWFIQHHGLEHRVIDYYEMSGEGLPHYARLLRGQVEGYERMADYTYGRHFAPHDIQVRELTTGKSRIETARSLGVKFRVVGKHEVEDGINAVRGILSQCWFDERRCERGIEALKGYRKEYDDRLKVFRDHPLHDWCSTAADAFRYFAWSYKGQLTRHRSKLPQDTAIDNFDYSSGTIDERENDYVYSTQSLGEDTEGL